MVLRTINVRHALISYSVTNNNSKEIVKLFFLSTQSKAVYFSKLFVSILIACVDGLTRISRMIQHVVREQKNQKGCLQYDGIKEMYNNQSDPLIDNLETTVFKSRKHRTKSVFQCCGRFANSDAERQKKKSPEMHEYIAPNATDVFLEGVPLEKGFGEQGNIAAVQE